MSRNALSKYIKPAPSSSQCKWNTQLNIINYVMIYHYVIVIEHSSKELYKPLIGLLNSSRVHYFISVTY